MTKTSHRAAIPEAPPVQAPAPVMQAARANCAARLRAQGHEVEAQCFERGERDQSFGMRHEVNKLLAEATREVPTNWTLVVLRDGAEVPPV